MFMVVLTDRYASKAICLHITMQMDRCATQYKRGRMKKQQNMHGATLGAQRGEGSHKGEGLNENGWTATCTAAGRWQSTLPRGWWEGALGKHSPRSREAASIVGFLEFIFFSAWCL